MTVQLLSQRHMCVQTRSDSETISYLLEYLETAQLHPKYSVGDQAVMGQEMESLYNRYNIKPIALGPGTPWPNRAEAAVRMFKKQVSLMLPFARQGSIAS